MTRIDSVERVNERKTMPMSKNQIRKSKRYGDHSLYYENLRHLMVAGREGEVRDAMRANLNWGKPNLSSGFVAHLRNQDELEARGAEQLIGAVVDELRVRSFPRSASK